MSRCLRWYLSWGRPLLATLLGLAFVVLVLLTYKWPLIHDAQVFHYANFLVDHGYRPYRDITDMNLPGTYLFEGTAMHIFGNSDLDWRLYDFALLILTGAAAIVIAMPYDWLAGLTATVLFAFVHANDGPKDGAQRDEAMTMLITVGFAFLFEALRRRRPWMAAVTGFALGVASTMKPTAALFLVVLLGLAWVELRRRDESPVAYLASGCAGALAAGAVVLGYLLRHDSLGPFIEISRTITPYYSRLGHTSVLPIALHALPNAVLLLLPFVLVAAFADRDWKSWERWALLSGIVLGLVAYLVQRKGYSYHRYPLTMLFLLWAAIELLLAIRRPQRWAAAAGFGGLAMIFVLLPRYGATAHRYPNSDPYTRAMVADLDRLGGGRLQHRVQCIDLVDGCYQALFTLKLLPSSGTMGDLLYFSPVPAPVVDTYRDQFQRELSTNPPTVVVVSNEWFGEDRSFSKLDQWPAFLAYLKQDFDLAVTRSFPADGGEAYRLYVRKGSGLPQLN